MNKATTGPANEDGMRDLLAPCGKSASVGQELGRQVKDGICKYISPQGSSRYVFNKDGQAQAVVQVMSQDGVSGVVTNAFTIPEARRTGIASHLIARARTDFEELSYSNALSPDGAALVQANPLNWHDWFSESKITDGSGEPLTVYHGTSKKFTRFDPNRQGDRAGVGGGFFFTSSHEVASEVYGWDKGGRVISVHLSIRNPLELDQYFEMTGKDKESEMGFDAPVNYFDNNWVEVVDFAKANGFDGIRWPADQDSTLAHDLIVAFKPEQIRLTSECEFMSDSPSNQRQRQ